MGLIARNGKAWLTLVLIIYNYGTTASRELPTRNRTDSLPLPSNGSRSISLNTNNLNNLLNKNPVQTINDGVNKTGIVTSINAIKTDLDNLSQQFNIFTFVDILINQTRQSIPLLVMKGNFTLLQAALLCAVGSMAAGAAIIVAEAFYFKKVKEQEFYSSHQHHEHGYYNKLPSLTYGHKSALERSDEDGAAVPKTRELHSKPVLGPSTLSPLKLAQYYENEMRRMNKPQSLKRSQRRRQRKNKNWAHLANNMQVLSEGFKKVKRSAPSRIKRQTSSLDSNSQFPDEEFSEQQFRPNSFNQFLLNSEFETRNDNVSTSGNSPQGSPPVFSGPRAPQEPLSLPPQQQQQFTETPPPFLPPGPTPAPAASIFDFVNIFKNAMTAFLNFLFDRNGGYATNIGSGPLSRNDYMQQQQEQGQRPAFRFPKLKPNRNFFPHAGK